MKKPSSRLPYFETLRGLAAFGVLFCHLSCVFYRELYYGEEARTAFERFWYNTPLNAINNGNLPVQFFFVLSGLLITRTIYSGKPMDGFQCVYRKYTKLLKLVIPAIILPFLLMRFHLLFHMQALEKDGALSFVQYTNNFSPSILSVPTDIARTFISCSNYNSPLWTIHFELLGSLLITVISGFIHQHVTGFWKRKISYMLFYFPLGFLNLNYCPFVIGALVFEIYHSMNETDHCPHALRRWMTSAPAKTAILILGLYFATINMNATGLWYPFHFLAQFSSQLRVLGVGLCLLCVLNSQTCQRLLTSRIGVFFGRLSPNIYIFHWPVILSVGSFTFLHLFERMPRTSLLLVVSCVSMVVTIAISILYEYVFGLAGNAVLRIKKLMSGK